MTVPHEDRTEIERKYEARAALDPLRAVLDAGDPDNRKNEFVNYLEQGILRRAFGEGRDPVAVDLGCGVGRFFGLLADRSDRVVGVDATGALLRVAKDRHLPAAVSLARGTITSIPLRDASASLVLCVGVLIHAVDDEDLARVASEVARVLRPGGRFVAIEHIAPGASERREGIVYRSLEEFRRPFVGAGLRVLSERPVRKVPSRVIHWVRTGRLPRFLWGLGAFLEPRLARMGREPAAYRDHLFVMERPRDPR